MIGNQYDQYLEEHVTILTENERVVGTLYYLDGARMSDFLNSPVQQESKFLKVKDATVYCQNSGEVIGKVPFAMVARDRVVMVMTHTPTTADDPATGGYPANHLGRAPARRFVR
jgi:hypothetical protein